MAYIDVEKGYFTPAQSDLNWAQTFRMTMRAPAVANRIFDTLAHMQDYINDTSQKASAIPGLLLVVTGDTANNGANNGVYEVLTVKETANGASGTYRKVGETMKTVSNWTTDLAPYTSPIAFLMNDTTNKTCYIFSVKEVVAGTKVNQYIEYPGGYYVREGDKSGAVWSFGNWTQKVYSTDIDSELSILSKNPVENKVVTNELNNKAEKVGIFPGLVAGGLLAKDTDAINNEDSFLFRSSGGSASISDGDAKLARVLGNVELNDNGQESPFSAATFKSVGFNAFNPAKKYEGYVLNANGSISQQSGSTIIVVHVLNSTAGAGNNNGYDISTADGYAGTYGKISGSTAFRIGFSMTEYTGGTKTSGYAQIINRSAHYNSQSYLAPNAGYFIINTDGVDLDKLCVHLCCSGYRDNDFEEYAESKITLPYSQIHDWGLGKANAVADEINLNEAVGIKRVDRILLSECMWTRHDNTAQEPNPDYDPSDPSSPEFIDVTYTSYSTNSLAGIIKNSTLNVQSCELNSAISGIEYIGITVSNAGQVTLQLEADKKWVDDKAPNRYLYYELAMPTQVNLEISPLYTVSDFGTEEFEDFTGFKFQCGRAYLLYLPNLIDGLRGLLARELADAVKMIYVHELALTDIVITATISGASKELTYVSGEDITIGSAKYGKFVDSSSNAYYISITGAVLNATLNVYTSDGTSVTSVGSYTKANVKPKNVVPTWGTNENADNTLFHLYNGATSGVRDLYYRYDAHFFTYISVANHIEPNKFFIWTTELTTGQVLFVTFDGITNPYIYNEYMIQFSTGVTIPTLSFPTGVKWNLAPELDVNMTYQVSVVNNIGLIAGGIE